MLNLNADLNLKDQIDDSHKKVTIVETSPKAKKKGKGKQAFRSKMGKALGAKVAQQAKK